MLKTHNSYFKKTLKRAASELFRQRYALHTGKRFDIKKP